MTTTPKTGAPELVESQADKEESVNECSRRIEAGASFYLIEDNDLTSPPGACADGAQYIVAATGSGLWAGKTGQIAISVGTNAANGWYFRAQEEGLFAWIKDENALFYCDVGSSPGSWVAYTASGGGGLLAANNLSDVANAVTAGANIRPVESLIVACSDETTALTAGTTKVTFRMPYAFTLTDVRASLSTAQTSGGQVIVDINEAGSTILSTKLIIDNGSKTSVGSSPSAVISDATLADNAEMTVDIDNIGDGSAKGLKVTLIGNRT